MDKGLEIGQISAIGSLQLFVAKMLSSIILAAGTIVLGWFVTQGDYGLYAIALIPAATILLFQDWGIGSAITRQCTQFRTANREEALRKTIMAGLSFEVATGLILTIFSLLTTNFIATTIFGKPESAALIAIVSVTILSTSILSSAQNVFIGFDQMKLYGLTMVCQAIAMAIVSPVLVYLGYGALGVVIGYTLSSAVACIFSAALLYFVVFRKLKKVKASRIDILETLKPMLRYGVPLALGNISSGLLTAFYSFMMASYVSPVLIGNYQIATNFGILVTFLSIPISTVLFPAFSKLDPLNEHGLVKTVFVSSVKYAALLLIPATMATIVLSQPLVGTFYGAKWSNAPFFLALFVSGNLFAFFGQLSMSSLFHATGDSKLIMNMNLITLAVGFPIAFILIPPLGITGMLIGLLVATVPSLFVGLYFAGKRYGIKIDLKSSTAILLASIVAAAPVYLFTSFFNTAYWLRLVAGLILFLPVYLISAPILGAVNQTDLDNLRTMFSNLGPLSGMLRIPLSVMEASLKIRS